MKDWKTPNPNTIHPIAGYDKEIYVKPTITNKNIIVWDFTYIADSEFESHVTHFYEWNNDKINYLKILSDLSVSWICYELSKPSDECCFNIPILYTWMMETNAS